MPLIGCTLWTRNSRAPFPPAAPDARSRARCDSGSCRRLDQTADDLHALTSERGDVVAAQAIAADGVCTGRVRGPCARHDGSAAPPVTPAVHPLQSILPFPPRSEDPSPTCRPWLPLSPVMAVPPYPLSNRPLSNRQPSRRARQQYPVPAAVPPTAAPAAAAPTDAPAVPVPAGADVPLPAGIVPAPEPAPAAVAVGSPGVADPTAASAACDSMYGSLALVPPPRQPVNVIV